MDDQLVQSFNSQKGLPIELLYIILEYLRQPQDPILLADISNFSRTWAIITNAYYLKWIIYKHHEIGDDFNWLENDFILYANENSPTGEGIKPKFKAIIYRTCNINNVSRIQFNTYAFYNKLSSKCRAFMLWGLFTPAERDEFVRLRG